MDQDTATSGDVQGRKPDRLIASGFIENVAEVAQAIPRPGNISVRSDEHGVLTMGVRNAIWHINDIKRNATSIGGLAYWPGIQI